MKLFSSFMAELLKLRHSRITWITFIAFALAPVMGGVFILILRNREALAKSGILSAKATSMNFTPDWHSYISILTQAVGVGGILVFGFVASWIFGREYSDGTSKDLLSLPTPRSSILNAKFFTYSLWCVLLSISNLLIGLLIGSILGLSGSHSVITLFSLETYLITTMLTILVGTPVAFFAVAGEGYLAPLGFVALILVFAQIIAATGFGSFFPWAVPGLYSSAAGEYRDQLNGISYSLVLLVSVLGYVFTQVWWQYADQTK